MKNYYDLLGLSQQASKEDIKRAYRRLSIKFHPDKNAGEAFFAEMFKQINEAQEILTDDTKRSRYDRQLNAHLNQESTLAAEQQRIRREQENLRRAQAEQERRAAQLREQERDFQRQQAAKGTSSSYQQQEKALSEEKQRLQAAQEAINKTRVEQERKATELREQEQGLRQRSNRTIQSAIPLAAKPQRPRRSDEWSKTRRWKGMTRLLWIVIVGLCIYIWYGPRKLHYFRPEGTDAFIIAPRGVYLRATPSVTGEKKMSLLKYSYVKLTAEKGPTQRIEHREAKWYKVQRDTTTGWVWGGYIEKIKE
jgi:curved DNA-binding protein CbpA